MDYDRASAGNAVSDYRSRQHAETTAAPPDQSPSQIRDRMTEAEDRLSDLHAAISHLESRLDTILTPQPPSINGGVAQGKPPQAPASHLLDRAKTIYLGIAEASDRLRQLMSRVEL